MAVARHLKKDENKRQMYSSQSTHLLFLGFQMSTTSRVWPTALKLGCVTNFDMLFLVMGFISLVNEIQFMLISSRHICIRSMYITICCLL